MEWITDEFRQAQRSGSGHRLAEIFLPPSKSTNIVALDLFRRASNVQNIRENLTFLLRGQGKDKLDLSRNGIAAWVEVFVAFWYFLGDTMTTKGNDIRRRRYDSWKEMTNILIKGYSGGFFESWTLPCLYVAGRWLRIFAIDADLEVLEIGNDAATISVPNSDDITATIAKKTTLEDAARVVNRMFTLCITDRAPMVDSRKWALYYITNLLFKTYFKLNSIALCKNPWRALQASHIDMPPIEAFPKSHICTFKYYVGLMFFLEEDYPTAESNLWEAYKLCHHSAYKNRELILSYLVPCRLLTARELLRPNVLKLYPRLQETFEPVRKAMRTGNLAAFDTALAAGEDEFVKARIYLTLERGRDICLRNLFRQVFLAGGYDDPKNNESVLEQVRRTRIPIEEFVTAVSLSLGDKRDLVTRDEVECLLANAIFKGLIKGYVARERGTVVLSKGNAFPGTGI